MSALTPSTTATRRPATVTAAIALLVLVVLLTALAIPPMLAAMGGFDPVFLGIAGTFAALKLAAAAGLSRCRRWAAILGFVAMLIDTLLTLPGFFDGTNGGAGSLIAAIVAVNLLTLVLLVLPASRRAYV